MSIKIESLRLKNFKAFKDITIRDIPRMCVVVGANGAGKSTLFDVFGFLRDSLTDNVQVALSKRGGFKEVRTRDADGGIEIELKSWYFGDLAAVETGLEIDGLTVLQTKAKYRNPDNIPHPSKELKKVTENRYQKVSGSRVIGKHLALDNKRSRSFRNFINGVRGIIAF